MKLELTDCPEDENACINLIVIIKNLDYKDKTDETRDYRSLHSALTQRISTHSKETDSLR